jgi:hypothetical protein
MKEGTVVVIERSTGNTIMRLPGACERSDGTIWASNNRNPLVMIGHLENADQLKKKYEAAMKARKPELIANEHLAHIGIIGDRRVEWDNVITAERAAKIKAEMTPARSERIEISRLFEKAERIKNSDSEDNVSLPMQIRSKARTLLAEWREKYPEEAAKEKANDLRAKAAHKRILASQALVYDADGWLSSAHQQSSHDAYIEEAEALEKEAARIGGES